MNFLSLQICKYCISSPKSRWQKSLQNPILKLFSVSWADICLIDSPWFVVAKGAEKCLQFLVSCHTICSSRDGVETFLRMDFFKIPPSDCCQSDYTCYLSRMKVHSHISKNETEQRKSKWRLFGFIALGLMTSSFHVFYCW